MRGHRHSGSIHAGRSATGEAAEVRGVNAVKTPSFFEAIRRKVETWLPKHGRLQTARAHAAILKKVEMALDRDRKGIQVLTPEQAIIYLKQMEHVMAGAVGDREWGLHEALKAKRAQI
jgi:hypothetical protein